MSSSLFYEKRMALPTRADAYTLAKAWRSSPTGRQYDYDPQKRGWTSRSDSGSLPVDVAFVRADIQKFIEHNPKVKLTANLVRDCFWFARLEAIDRPAGGAK